MIKATLKTTGLMVDQPRVNYLTIDNEDEIAVKKRDEETDKLIQLTIGQLYDAYIHPMSYDKTADGVYIEPSLFLSWFNSKYITGKGIQTSILSLEFKRL